MISKIANQKFNHRAHGAHKENVWFRLCGLCGEKLGEELFAY